MHPTPRLVLWTAGLLPLGLLATLSAVGPWVWLAGLAAVLIAMAADAGLLLDRSRRLALRVDVAREALLGEPLEVRVEASGVPGTALELVLEADERFAPVPPVQGTLEADGRLQTRLPLAAQVRGSLEVTQLWMRILGPLGLMRRVRRMPVDRCVEVLPNVRRVRQEALAFFGTRTLDTGPKIERHLGDGTEFHALREWTHGMDSRAISWRSSARHRRLVGLERRAERSHRIVLAVDTGHLMAEPVGDRTRLDHAIEAALLLAWAGLKAGDRVGLYAFDERPRAWLEPVGSLARYEGLRRALARLPYTRAETNFTLGLTDLATRLDRRSLVVLLTEFVDVIAAEVMFDALARLSRRHLVLFATLQDARLVDLAGRRPSTLERLHQAVVAQDLVRERESVLRRLRRLGVHTVDAMPGGVSAALLNRYLDVKRRELVG
jgi:uncharacterized protein (DUF58 family)